MKSFLAAALLGVASAYKVHDFFAERNYICELCKTAVQFEEQGYDAGLDKMYEKFPKLQEKIHRINYVKMLELYDGQDPQGTCERIELCEEFDVAERLRGEQPIDQALHIETVNSKPGSTWVAGENIKFKGASRSEVQKLMGTVVDPDWTLKSGDVVPASFVNDDLPENFDAREQWPKCASTINHVRDQANCGSCWAHGTTEAYNDRKCIADDGAFTKLLSVADTTGCCNFVQCQSMGCNGGQVGSPWNWFTRKGVVTGGDYGDGDFCYDYTMPQCAHHVESTTLPSCDDIKKVAPKCNSECVSNTEITYADDKNKASSSYGFGVFGAVDKIKQDIYQYGSVTGAFTVFEDFLTYKSGVYQHESGAPLGGHAIKVIGWGKESGEDYWLCVNSWNDTWGDKGLFKIKMGACGINNQMHAGRA